MNAPAPRSNVLKGTQISCMLPVIDLERARRFYGEQLGLEAVGAKQSGKFVYRCGGTEVALFPKPGGTKATHSTLSFQVKDIVAAIDEAAQAGACLIVFPEAFVPGYPAWIWRLRPGGDMALSERLHSLLRANAVNLAADDLAPLREAARRHQVSVVCGIHELDADFSRTTLYNTVVTIGPDGALLNRHRKVMPTSPERMVWGFGDATGLKPVDTPCGRVGALICWESYMPLARCALYAQGVDIYVAPTYDSGERSIATMQHIAREGGCWVLCGGCAFQGRDIL